MKLRGGIQLVLWVTLMGCRSPVLWVGTAHSEVIVDSLADAGTGKARPDGAAAVPPAAADPRDAGAPSSTATGVAGQQPPAAGAVSQLPGRSMPPRSVDADMDAGRSPSVEPKAPPTPTRLPQAKGECPDLAGPGTYTFRAGSRSLSAQLHMLPKAARNAGSPGPLILYFHAFGTTSAEVVDAFGQTAIDAVVNQGGVVASFNSVPCLRCGLDDLVWYNEDDVVTDQAVACIRAQATIDMRHIHVLGFSAGALHSLHLAMVRNDFIASVISYSGGVPPNANVPEPQDPTNKAPVLLSFGDSARDNVVADFNAASHAWWDKFHPRDYYVMMCNHGGGHEIPAELPKMALRFFLDHPYRVSPEPYADGVPREYPKYCNNGP